MSALSSQNVGLGGTAGTITLSASSNLASSQLIMIDESEGLSTKIFSNNDSFTGQSPLSLSNFQSSIATFNPNSLSIGFFCMCISEYPLSFLVARSMNSLKLCQCMTTPASCGKKTVYFLSSNCSIFSFTALQKSLYVNSCLRVSLCILISERPTILTSASCSSTSLCMEIYYIVISISDKDHSSIHSWAEVTKSLSVEINSLLIIESFELLQIFVFFFIWKRLVGSSILGCLTDALVSLLFILNNQMQFGLFLLHFLLDFTNIVLDCLLLADSQADQQLRKGFSFSLLIFLSDEK